MLTKPKPRFEYLKPFDLGDQDLFLGRDQEVDRLYEMVFESNVILVYGMAKTGKTSLVDCGLASRFSSANWLLVHVRRTNNINTSLRCSLIDKLKELPEGIPDGVEEYSLGKLLYCLFLTYLKPIYLVFDQFEEVYLDGEKEERRQFIADLEQVIHRQKSKTKRDIFIHRISSLFETATEPDLDGKKTAKAAIEKFRSKLKVVRRSIQQTQLNSVNEVLTDLDQLCDQNSAQKAVLEIRERLRDEENSLDADTERNILANLNCKVILIMREEYVAFLNDFEEKVPELASKKLRLEPMTDNVLIRKVIPGLCAASSMQLVDEPESDSDVDQEPIAADIVRQVKNNVGFVNLAYLNFYLKALWDAAPTTDDDIKEVNQKLIEDTGHVQDLLRQLLEVQKMDVAAKLQSKYPEITSDTVGEILSIFVTLEGNSRPRDQEEIRVENVTAQLVNDCLNLLGDANIVRHTPHETHQGTVNQFELTDTIFAQHIHKAWNEPQRRYFSARSMILEAYEASQTNFLKQFRFNTSMIVPQAFLVLPATSLALILPYEQRLKAELQPDVWAFWMENKRRIEEEIRTEVRRERLIKRLFFGILLILIVSGGWLIMENRSTQKKNHQLAQTEGNRLLQLLDNSNELSSLDSTVYSALTNPVYNNPSLKYKIAAIADSILPEKSRSGEWLDRLMPMPGGTPFYNLSIDAHRSIPVLKDNDGSLVGAGFLPDGRIYARFPDQSDSAQIWTLSTTHTPWKKNNPQADTIKAPKSSSTGTKSPDKLIFKKSADKNSFFKLAKGISDSDSLLFDNNLFRVLRLPGGRVRFDKGSTNSFGAPPIILKGHRTPVIAADMWTNRENGMTLLLTADSTGLIRLYNTTDFCFTSTCLAQLLPSEKSDLGLELTEVEINQLALSRDWNKLCKYLFKLEDHYHELGQINHKGLDNIVNRLINAQLLNKQAPETIYSFWLRVVSLAKTEQAGHSQELYYTMEKALKNFMLKWKPDSIFGQRLARAIQSSDNRLDLLLGVRFLERWGQLHPSATFSLREKIYNRALNLNALDPSDIKSYLDFATQAVRRQNSIVWVIYNLSLLSQQSMPAANQSHLQQVIDQAKKAIADLPEQPFRESSQVELVLSVVDDTLWSAVRIAEYIRRMPADNTYYHEQLVEAYGNISYHQLMAKDYGAAIESAKNGLKQPAVKVEREWINTNLALAYLLNGQFNEAAAIYRKFKDHSYTLYEKSYPFNESFLDDLDAAEQKGIIPRARKSDVAKIRQLIASP